MGATGVRKWLGIPFARASRFGAPEPAPFDAGGVYDRFGPAAPQSLDSPLGEIVPGMRVTDTDEDACLTLNVWAPEHRVGAGALPVLVWVHGGSFVIGSSAQPVYDGELLAAEQDVVVVTVNYRLGALGFLDARVAGGVANCGVRDLVCALEWLHEHVASFGGDPARVVAFGESAGGGLLLHALASPLAQGLLAGAIVQSGATFATLDAERAAVVADTLCKEAAVDDVGALRALPADTIVEAQARAMSALLGSIGMMPFHPMVDGDVLPARPVEALQAGAAAGVPLLAGSTADEMRLFLPPATEPLSAERLRRRVARYVGFDEPHAQALIEGYERDLGTTDPDLVWGSVFSDVEMQVPLRAVLDAHAPHGPAYTYLFTWEGPDVGSCHGIDIPFPFGNFDDGWTAFAGIDGDGLALSRRMRDAWASFARTGDPGWPAYPKTMILGRTQDVAPSHPMLVRAPAL